MEGFTIGIYYAIDGDDIGKKFEGYVLRNDVDSILCLSELVKSALRSIKVYIETMGGDVLFCEGDSLLAISEEVIALPMDLLVLDDISFSTGVGESTATALLALKKAKGLGKKRIEFLMGVYE